MTHLKQDLSGLINPRSVAVIGASDNLTSIGGRALQNLLEFSDFKGELYLVNPTRESIAGRQCWPDVLSLPAVPEVVVVAIPAAAAVVMLEQCGRLGVKYAIVFTSGFGEGGGDGLDLAERLRQVVAETGMRIYGPNCPGLCNVNKRLGFTFSPSFRNDLRAGPIGLVTQGGGLGRNVMQSMDRGVGIGLWCSTGNELDLQVADFIDYMAEAPDIKVIVTLLEGIKNGPRFVQAVQHAARRGKPVVAFKVGKSEYGQRAAQSHTASLTGSAEINSAVFRQLGVIEVDDIDELVDTAWLLARALPDRPDPEFAVYCSSGGTSALTADMIGTQGMKLAKLSAETSAVLRARLPSYAAIDNPIDTTTAVLADLSIVDETLLAVCKDPNVSAVFFPMALDYGAVTEKIARSIVSVQERSPVPIIPIWMSDRAGEAFHVFAQAGMVPVRSVGKAVKAVRRWMQYAAWKASADLGFEPALLKLGAGGGEPAVALTEDQGKEWLRDGGVTMPCLALAREREDAAAQARRMGFPVVAKIVSPDVQHKSDVGGVRLHLTDEAQVLDAWDGIHAAVGAACPQARLDGILIEPMAPPDGFEVLVGVTRDPVLGHVMTCGLGGIYVEIFKDTSCRMLPVSHPEAKAMITELRCSALLQGARGQDARDVEALAALLVRISDFTVANGDLIEEMDLNPVWVGRAGQGAYPLDSVIVARSRSGGSHG